jgi:polygalacturonase
MDPILRREFLAASAAAVPGLLNVRDYGVSGDGRQLNTKALQRAVDACAAAGGGVVYFPPGRYLTGTVCLKSNVALHLETGAVLLGSTNLQDYPSTVPAFRSYTDNYTEKSLIYGEKVDNVAIEGRGVIDGQGAAFKGPYRVRPYLIRIISSKNVSVTDVTIRDSPMWVQHYLDCDNVSIRGITVASRCNQNNDGIDIDSSSQVRISDCDISSGDDAIVLKSTSARPCRDVVITNCVLSTACNALKLGTESNGGFENVAISNCSIYDTRLAGIALEIVDGGLLDRVNVSNITMRNAGCPIFVRLGNRARPFQDGMGKPGIGRLRNVMIGNVQATGANKVGCSITGLPGHPIENITLHHIRIEFTGGGTREDAESQVPENPDKYPEYAMFGVLPAYGLYCRHVRNITLDQLETRLASPDQRPVLVTDDVEGLHQYPTAVLR